MKRILTLVLVLMAVVGSTIALASGEWHYCDFCGREHSGVICPEECQNDCAWNREGSQHKWYDCSERVITTCWYCGEETQEHNENCCPNGDLVWNDKKGTFRSAEYSGEDGVRLPEYCDFCQHYGYHSSDECLKNENRIEPTEEPTAEPTEEPTKEPTVEPTEALQDIATVEPTEALQDIATLAPCVHYNVSTQTEVKSRDEQTKEYCYVVRYRNVDVCEDCRVSVSAEYDTEEKVQHTLYNGTCTNCGYVAFTPTEAPCGHYNVSTQKEVKSREEQTKEYCYVEKYRNVDICEDCQEIVSVEYDTEEKVQHTLYNGTCSGCGYVAYTASTEQPSSSECKHPNTNEYCRGNIWYEAEGDICFRCYEGEVWCEQCGTVILDGIIRKETAHVIRNGVCNKCGTSQVAQVVTPEPTVSYDKPQSETVQNAENVQNDEQPVKNENILEGLLSKVFGGLKSVLAIIGALAIGVIIGKSRRPRRRRREVLEADEVDGEPLEEDDENY